MKSIKIHNHAPSSRRETLPHHEHAARRARAKSIGLPRKQNSTPPTTKPSLFLTHPLSQPDLSSSN